jgi:hypothetical protein
MVEIDPDIKWSSLRRAMKTFIITDEKFLQKLKETLKEAGINA